MNEGESMQVVDLICAKVEKETFNSTKSLNSLYPKTDELIRHLWSVVKAILDSPLAKNLIKTLQQQIQEAPSNAAFEKVIATNFPSLLKLIAKKIPLSHSFHALRLYFRLLVFKYLSFDITRRVDIFMILTTFFNQYIRKNVKS
jgi:hypothetical protein